MQNIDRDRGCTIRFHPQGFRVIMYKDAPGEYIDEQGKALPEKIAGQAGFEVENLAKEARKQARLAKAQQQVEQEFASQDEQIEQELSEGGGQYTVKHVGGGKYAIIDGDGNRMTQTPLSKDQANELLADLNTAADGG